MHEVVPDFSSVVVGFRQWRLAYDEQTNIKDRFQLIAPFVNSTWNLHQDADVLRPTGFIKAYCNQKYRQFFNVSRSDNENPVRDKGCPKPLHDAPDKECSCGFHAYHDPNHLHGLFAPHSILYAQKRDIKVVGVCQLAGKSQLYKKGIRAEYIRIAAILPPSVSAFHALAIHFSPENKNQSTFIKNFNKYDNKEWYLEKRNLLQAEFLDWAFANGIDFLEKPFLNSSGALKIPETWLKNYGSTVSKHMIDEL